MFWLCVVIITIKAPPRPAHIASHLRCRHFLPMKLLNVNVFVWHLVRCKERCGDQVQVGGLVPSDTHLSRSISHEEPHHVVPAICAMCRLRTDSTTAEAAHVLVNGSVAVVFRLASQSRLRQQDYNLSRNTQHVHTMSSCKY